MSRDLTAIFQREQLHRATRLGNLAEVDRLIKQKYPLNRFDELGKTPLHYAVESGQVAIVHRLIKAGANVNAHDERMIGNTPLSDNILNCSLEMVSCLIAAGADPTIRGWMQLNANDRAKARKDSAGKKILQIIEKRVSR